MKRVLIRADSSFAIGHGHIMRTLVLAKKYRKKGYEVYFATLDLEGNLNKKIKEEGFFVYILETKDIQELIFLIKEEKINTLVVDNYEIKYEQEKEIKKQTNIKLVCLDDTYEKHYCDILINHNISADEKKYKNLVPKTCELKCGAEFTLLREEFYKYKNKNIKKTSIKTNIFLAIGGTDHSNINIKILEVLKEFDNINVFLVTTSANKNLNELEKYCKDNTFIKLFIDTNKMAKLMRKSDFAIVSASVILNEVYFMNLPFIAIKTADNQNDIYKYLKDNSYLVLKKFNTKKLKKCVKILKKV
ncbi:UDP-2,4-diacetamido-2,4,6-trideoxy-beta-L-altropyranose hydrolase [Malaciobacter sp. WC5094]|uniref:UDP-2,4-diacetamido-2,4, 6-trideoxy-beta-L-altropyranose hydrolase n=1 Tax=Arcobacter sp. YIC-80 TaxID=3376683 RepID=UPI00384EAD6A